MNECHHIHETIVEALYDNLNYDQKSELNAHLQSCPDCARFYQQMAETLRVMNARETAEPDEAFWASYSERLAVRLESQQQLCQTPLLRRLLFERLPWYSHPMLRAGAIAALVLIGVFLGMWIRTEEYPSGPVPEATVSTPDQANAANVLVEDRVQSYLQKSKVLLLALANFDPRTDDTATLNLQNQRRISESLVQEAMYLQTALADPAEIRLHELVGDLEVILLQIANLDDEYDLEAVEMLRSGVNKRGILFRIDLSQMSRRMQEAFQDEIPKAKNSSQI